MAQSPSKPGNFEIVQGIPLIFLRQTFHYHIPNSSPFIPVLSQFK